MRQIEEVEEKSEVYLDSQVEMLFWETESDPLGQMSSKTCADFVEDSSKSDKRPEERLPLWEDWPGCFCREEVDCRGWTDMSGCWAVAQVSGKGVLDSAGKGTGGGRRDGILGRWRKGGQDLVTTGRRWGEKTGWLSSFWLGYLGNGWRNRDRAGTETQK